MRNLFIFSIIMSLLVFTSCQEDDVKIADEVGNISGMGSAGGELQAEDYSLPEGISIVGEIEGILEDEGKVAESLKSTNSYKCYGSGGDYVKIRLTLKNNSPRKRTAFLPAGLLFQVDHANFQHAILLCWTWICFEPNETRTFDLNLYCINKGKTESLVGTKFKMLGVTKSKVMERIIRWCGLKKINIEHYTQITAAGLKSEVSYEVIIDELQRAVWALTDGEGLSEAQEAFILSLPDLDSSLLPEGIGEDDFEAPPYWEEYGE